jgi:hypothetical protein
MRLQLCVVESTEIIHMAPAISQFRSGGHKRSRLRMHRLLGTIEVEAGSRVQANAVAAVEEVEDSLCGRDFHDDLYFEGPDHREIIESYPDTFESARSRRNVPIRPARAWRAEVVADRRSRQSGRRRRPGSRRYCRRHSADRLRVARGR